jgi:co-chaperonin GroES (HSP10)
MKVKGKIIPLRNNVLVCDMEFGMQTTAGGIVLHSDNGKSAGVKPRWGRVWAIGPDQDEVKVGEWILIEHGRWTRGFKVDDGEGEKELRMVEAESIIAYADEKPNDLYIGEEYSNGSSTTINPQDFIR